MTVDSSYLYTRVTEVSIPEKEATLQPPSLSESPGEPLLTDYESAGLGYPGTQFNKAASIHVICRQMRPIAVKCKQL